MPLRRSLRAARLAAWVLLDRLRGSDSIVPAAYPGLIGSGDFEQVGEEFLHHFEELCGLQPSDNVLDVGCGLGRMAVPLTRYLDGGTYHGFDVVAPAIESCRRRITSRFPAFTFDHVDVVNGKYNPRGKVPAVALRFPYADEEFDLVFTTSVFTHMRRGEIQRYLSEIARVLKPRGRTLTTWFLITPETTELVREGRTEPIFVMEREGTWLADPKEPELAVAYEEQLARRLYLDAGLKIVEPVRHGSWRGLQGLSYQDIVVAGRADALVTPVTRTV